MIEDLMKLRADKERLKAEVKQLNHKVASMSGQLKSAESRNKFYKFEIYRLKKQLRGQK